MDAVDGSAGSSPAWRAADQSARTAPVSVPSLPTMSPLERAAVEIEAHVGAAGWDRRPTLFALVNGSTLATDEPDAVARLGLDTADPDHLTPIEQDDLPDGELDEMLASIAWPDSVSGCAVTQEIVIMPPSAQAEGQSLSPAQAAAHPDRREGRLVAAVGRDGASAVVLRLRARPAADPGDGAAPTADQADDLVTGPDLAPNVIAALLATFDD